MPLDLLPAVAQDMPTFTNIYLLAFQHSIHVACFPRDSPHVRAWWTDGYERFFANDSTGHFLKVVEDGKAIAYARWCVPEKVDGQYVALAVPDRPSSWPQDTDVELCEEFFGAFPGKRRRIMGDRPHCCTVSYGSCESCGG